MNLQEEFSTEGGFPTWFEKYRWRGKRDIAREELFKEEFSWKWDFLWREEADLPALFEN